MNKEQLIEKGLALETLSELSLLRECYEEWKNMVIEYASRNDYIMEQCRIQLHMVETPFESKEEILVKYRSCVKRGIKLLQDAEVFGQETDALERVICNFDLFLQNMFRTKPENKATLQQELLDQVTIQNEYDVQHIMYAVIKALYPSARREVSQDTGYGTVRYDIVIEEIDTVIEIKCTRKDHSEAKLYRELGEDGYFYRCSRLIIYIYDKQKIIHDVGNFRKSLSRTTKTAGKEVHVYVEQTRNLI
ncbi:MAG: hypothetical protein Q4C66_05500 [Lachnospiraceae bacterium]|nr:hypothetical protein [Lachnospiraceae bacterium]